MPNKRSKTYNIPYIKLIIAAIILLLAVILQLKSSSNFDECMVRSMKGQDKIMYASVYSLCAKKYNKEQEIPTDSVKFSITDDKNIWGASRAKISVFENSSEYVVKEATLAFSQKDCKTSSPEDFILTKTVQINNNEAFIPYEHELDKMTYTDILISNSTFSNCSKITSLKGFYK